ncbi:MAG: AIPR family protein [Cyanobacteria bacterium]|nr:AIPR family protein [Cyanobacteriota bacterium]
MLDLNYSNLIQVIQPYIVKGRVESSAFLIWFLVNIYRLDIIEAQNIVCDGPGDKGIDGIYINESEECIDIFQSRTVQNPQKTLGDVQLKEFIGSLEQLGTDEGISSIIDSTRNSQLKNLLEEHKDLFTTSEYSIRGIFVTNTQKDRNAEDLLQATPKIQLEVWDRDSISRAYVPSEKTIPETSEITLDVFGVDFIQYSLRDIAKSIIAPIMATDLVRMEGIENQQLFDLNLRKGLNQTKVNKDIQKSILDSSEHSSFLLYHNGITVICNAFSVSEKKDKIKMRGYSVVNGCQTVTSLYKCKNSLSKDLRILTRIVQVGKDQKGLTSKITKNSNNQNGIKARDFRSNTKTQTRLQEDVSRGYPEYFYDIKRGDAPKDKKIIENTLAGQILLAFDRKKPSSVQRYSNIFDNLHQEIFARPEVAGGRIVILFELYQEVEKKLPDIEPSLFGGYQITKFFLLYLLAEVLNHDEQGKNFCKQPESFYVTDIQKNALLKSIRVILGDLVIDLNAEFDDAGGESFDFKAAFKVSVTGVENRSCCGRE